MLGVRKRALVQRWLCRRFECLVEPRALNDTAADNACVRIQGALQGEVAAISCCCCVACWIAARILLARHLLGSTGAWQHSHSYLVLNTRGCAVETLLLGTASDSWITTVACLQWLRFFI